MKEHKQTPQTKSTNTRKILFKMYVIALIVSAGAFMVAIEELLVDRIISLIAVLAIGSPFLMVGKSFSLDIIINWLFGLTPLIAVSPWILAITLDGHFHWFIFVTVPAAGIILAIAFILKIINVIRNYV